jgi:hypothetical protein
MRIELEAQVRKELEEERRKEQEATEAHFKKAMAIEVEKVVETVREEAKVQLQAHIQSLRYVSDKQQRPKK